MNEEERQRLETEVRIAAAEGAFEKSVMSLGDLSTIACPDCHGTLVRLREGGTVRYRCHTGHAFTPSALLSGVTEGVEESLWNAVRALEESIMLLHQLGEHYAGAGEARAAELFLDKAHEAEERSRQVRQMLLRSDPLSNPLLREDTQAVQDPNLP